LETKTRNPIIAVVLSLVTPGLGQIYNGELRKGLVFYFLLSLFPLLLLLAKLQYTFTGMLVLLFALITPYFANAGEACFTARKKNAIILKPYNKWYFYILFVLLSFALQTIAEGLAKFDFKESMGTKSYKIPSGAMIPTILIGDRIIVDLKYYTNHDPQKGDIVVFRYPEDPTRDFIKRIVATENDIIESKDKAIYINGTAVAEAFTLQVDSTIRPKDNDQRDNFGPLTVPKDKLFVMGDNRDQSYDSRYWGYVDKNQIRGKALYFYWSKQTNKIGKEII